MKILVVVTILVGIVLAKRLYRQWRHRIETAAPVHPRVPARLLGAHDRTWLVFTTPYCATCGPVIERIRALHPGAHVVKVDATVEVALADAFSVKAAPTVLLADSLGTVEARIVGAENLERWATAIR